MPMRVVVAAVAALARVEGKQKRYRIAMFKESRTGSTWAADLLANEPAVNFFAQAEHAERLRHLHVVGVPHRLVEMGACTSGCF